MKYLLSILVLLITYRSTANLCFLSTTRPKGYMLIEDGCRVDKSNVELLGFYMEWLRENYLNDSNEVFIAIGFSYANYGSRSIVNRDNYTIGYYKTGAYKRVSEYDWDMDKVEDRYAAVLKIDGTQLSYKAILNLIYYTLENKREVISRQRLQYIRPISDMDFYFEWNNLLYNYLYDKEGVTVGKSYLFHRTLDKQVIDSIISADIPFVDDLLARGIAKNNTEYPNFSGQQRPCQQNGSLNFRRKSVATHQSHYLNEIEEPIVNRLYVTIHGQNKSESVCLSYFAFCSTLTLVIGSWIGAYILFRKQ